MIRQVADAVLRHRLAVLLCWISFVLAAGVIAAQLNRVLQGGADAIPGSESDQVTRTIQEKFGAGTLYQFLVVMKSEGPILDPHHAVAAQKLARELRSVPGVRAIQTYWSSRSLTLLGKDGQTALAIVTPRVNTYYEAELLTEELRTAVRRTDLPPGLSAYVTGTTAMLYDLDHNASSDLLEAERIGLPIALAILLVAFGAPLAALLPIVLALAAVALSLAGLFWLSYWTPVSVFAQNVVSMIGLGVGVDYALFIVSRFRGELSQGCSTSESANRALVGACHTVLFSGATVAIGFSALFLVNAPFLHAIALGGMLVVLAAVAVSLTLLPVLLSYFGAAVNWPRRTKAAIPRGNERRGLWSRWASLVMRHPGTFLTVGTLLLAVFVLPVLRLQPWNIGAQHLGEEMEARKGYELLAREFERGWMGPMVLLVEAAPGRTVWEEPCRKAILALSARLEKEPRIAQVQGFPQLLLRMHAPGQTTHSGRDLPEPLRVIAREIVSPDGRVALMALLPTVSPESRKAMALLEELRQDSWTEAAEAGLKVRIGGATAVMADFDRELFGSLWRVVPAVMLVTFLVLLVLFRSLLIPLKATVLNLLSVLAAYGFLVLVFQDGIGAHWIDLTPPGGLNSFIVLVLFTLLFGLSMDYEVFLLGQVREEYQATGDNARAVSTGLERTAGIITSAALIMIAVFASFGFTRMVATRELGLGLAFAIALDATAIRLILAPALMTFFGPLNWWLPGWLGKILPSYRPVTFVPASLGRRNGWERKKPIPRRTPSQK